MKMDLRLSRCLVLAVCVCVTVGDADGHSAGAPGAPVRLSDSDPGLLQALKFAEERYNVLSNGMHIRRVSKIISASKQVRHCGFLYFIYDIMVFMACVYIYLSTKIIQIEAIRQKIVFRI